MSSPRSGPPFGVIGFAAVAAAGALLLVLGPPRDRSTPHAAPTVQAPAVGAGGVTLTAASAELPDEDLALPEAPGVDVVRANCTSCHSPAVILSQPPLTRAQWQAEVEKMQKAYHAPVDAKAVPAIVAYLSGLSGHEIPSPAFAGEEGPAGAAGGR